MTLWQFIFYFLYARNWYTGKMELSRPRLVLFSAMLFLIVFGVLIASILQAPVSYDASGSLN